MLSSYEKFPDYGGRPPLAPNRIWPVLFSILLAVCMSLAFGAEKRKRRMSLTSDMIARWQEWLSGLEKIVADHESGRARIDQVEADKAKLALKRLRTIVEAIEKDRGHADE